MKLFFATPISSIKDYDDLIKYKRSLVKLMSVLRTEHDVVCEIDAIRSADQYDSPKDSYLKDFAAISECDVFLLHYPSPSPTSALIELGCALALNKRVIVITPDKNCLPYLAREIDKAGVGCSVIESNYLGKVTTQKIIDLLRNWEFNGKKA